MTRPAQLPLPARVNPLYPADTPPQVEDVRRAHAEREAQRWAQVVKDKVEKGQGRGNRTDNGQR